MGNGVSKYNENMSIDKYDKMALYIDLIANRIILKEVKQNSALNDSGRCSQLIIITSEILKRLPFRVISYMNRKRKTFGNDYDNFAASEQVLMLDTHSSSIKENGMDEPDTYKKTQMCIGIARFYVQVGNLFNAIMSTIRPFDYMGGLHSSNTPYNYCDLLANSLFEKENFDKYASSNLHQYVKKQRDMNVKLERLKRDNKHEEERMFPSVCSVYDKIKSLQSHGSSSSSSSSSSSRKHSIFSSLDRLYLDVFHERSYTNSKPEFIEMSNKMLRDIYLPDVHTLYKKVTGRDAGPDIRSFSDIPFEIDNSSINENCNSNTNAQQNPNKTNKNLDSAIVVDDNLRTNQYFENYVSHIKKMISKTNQQRGELIELLNKVFVINRKTDTEIRRIQDEFGKGNKRMDGMEGTDRSDGNNSYSRHFQKYSMLHNFFINPNLTDSMLQEIINEARIKIVRMYVSCQENFVEGVKLLDALHKNAQLRFDTNSRHVSSNNQGNAHASSGHGSHGYGHGTGPRSVDDMIDFIKNALGNFNTGVKFNRLMYKVDEIINNSISIKQTKLTMAKEKFVQEFYGYIEKELHANKNINDQNQSIRLTVMMDDFKIKIKAITDK